MTWRDLRADDADAVHRLAGVHPDSLTFTAAVVQARRHGFDLAGAGIRVDARPDGTLVAMATTRGGSELFAPDPATWPAAAAELRGRLGPGAVITGPAEQIAGVLEALGPGAPAPRRTYDTGIWLADATTLPGGPDPDGFRAATIDDLVPIAANCAALAEAELGRDPRAVDERGFMQGVAWQIINDRYYVITGPGGDVRYQVLVGRDTPGLVALEAAWIPPAFRGQGLGKAGLWAATRRALALEPRAFGFTRVDNGPQTGGLRAAGYVREPRDHRTAIF